MAYRINAQSRRRLVLGVAVAVLALVASGFALTAYPHRGHLVVLVIAVSLVVLGVRQGLHYTRAKRWRATEATVLEIQEDWIDVILHYNALKYYYPKIKYQYIVEGVDYISDVVGFDVENIWVPEFDSWGIKTDDRAKFWQGWVRGSRITAYVNAKDPSECVIVNKIGKKIKSQMTALIVGGMLMGVIWLYLAFMG